MKFVNEIKVINSGDPAAMNVVGVVFLDRYKTTRNEQCPVGAVI